jgi:hypothetical protein
MIRLQQRWFGAILLGVCAILSMTGARAQPTPDDIALGRRVYQQTADCRYCHGWAGDGLGDPRSPGNAANLRVTKLDRDAFVEVILCGRPASAMPHFDRLAYTDRRCYGVTEADLGADTPTIPPSSFISRRQAEAVADYLIAEVVGKGPPTFEQCVAEIGAGPDCDKYKK